MWEWVSDRLRPGETQQWLGPGRGTSSREDRQIPENPEERKPQGAPAAGSG